jgi:hypothetical protein
MPRKVLMRARGRATNTSAGCAIVASPTRSHFGSKGSIEIDGAPVMAPYREISNVYPWATLRTTAQAAMIG